MLAGRLRNDLVEYERVGTNEFGELEHEHHQVEDGKDGGPEVGMERVDKVGFEYLVDGRVALNDRVAP